MEQIALIIFLITYAGVALGGIPGQECRLPCSHC